MKLELTTVITYTLMVWKEFFCENFKIYLMFFNERCFLFTYNLYMSVRVICVSGFVYIRERKGRREWTKGIKRKYRSLNKFYCVLIDMFHVYKRDHFEAVFYS